MVGPPGLLLLLTIISTCAMGPEPEPEPEVGDATVSLIAGLSVLTIVLTIISLGIIGFFIKVHMEFI